ncbi:MAG: glycine--tRNA ligase subunit beta [Cyanobacteria bacterium P01_F01_bin.33]
MVSFLLEVGTEELPASFVKSAITQWQSDIPANLAAFDLAHESVRVFGTPRRLAVRIDGLPARQSDRVDEVKGPPVQVAYRDGEPTPALTGFARKQGAEVADLEIRETPKGEFVFASVRIVGRATDELLQDIVPNWVTDLKGDRLMRWGHGTFKFPRPIRWLVSLWDDHILPIEVAGLSPGRTTQGHRVMHPAPLVLQKATDYPRLLADEGYVQPDRDKRASQIQAQALAVAKAAGGVAVIPDELLEEVTDLVEWPTAVVGQFEPEFLELPAPVIKSVMVTHQRYFAVTPPGKPEELLPCFVTISNGDPAKSKAIAAGNGRVIRARLADGRFFYTEDQKHPLETFVPQLEKVTFVEGLGSMKDKVERIQQISAWMAAALQVSDRKEDQIDRTAYLCKADLLAQMVYEFPEMQGIMGRDYLLRSGEDAEVAAGVEQHYWPLGAGDRLPVTLTGQVVGIADRLDSLVGLFKLGKIPSGSSDRFALRRAANSIVQILWDAELPLDLLALLEQVTSTYAADATETLPNLRAFFIQRVQTLLQEDIGIDYDLVQAVIGNDDDPMQTRSLQELQATLQRAHYLQELRQSGTLAELYPTVNRTARLAAQGTLDYTILDPTQAVQEELLQEPAERALFSASQTIYARGMEATQQRDFSILVDALAIAAPAITTFFDDVLVMAKQPQVKTNRLNLLGVLRNNARLLADFSAVVMAGEKSV